MKRCYYSLFLGMSVATPGPPHRHLCTGRARRNDAEQMKLLYALGDAVRHLGCKLIVWAGCTDWADHGVCVHVLKLKLFEIV